MTFRRSRRPRLRTRVSCDGSARRGPPRAPSAALHRTLGALSGEFLVSEERWDGHVAARRRRFASSKATSAPAGKAVAPRCARDDGVNPLSSPPAFWQVACPRSALASFDRRLSLGVPWRGPGGTSTGLCCLNRKDASKPQKKNRKQLKARPTVYPHKQRATETTAPHKTRSGATQATPRAAEPTRSGPQQQTPDETKREKQTNTKQKKKNAATQCCLGAMSGLTAAPPLAGQEQRGLRLLSAPCSQTRVLSHAWSDGD